MQAEATSFGQWKGKSLHEPRNKRGNSEGRSAMSKRQRTYLGGLQATALLLGQHPLEIRAFPSPQDQEQPKASSRRTVWDLLRVLRSPGRAVHFQLNHLGPGMGGRRQREENVCTIRLQNEQGGLGSWSGKARSFRAAGLSPVSRETVVSFPGFGEGRKRQRWCLQRELESPAAPEPPGTVKTGRSCWSGSDPGPRPPGIMTP